MFDSTAFAQSRREEAAPSAQEAACDLCGLPLGRPAQAGVAGESFRFCCPGCRQVFLLLSDDSGGLPPDFRETELYRACIEYGIIPRQAPASPEPLPEEACDGVPPLLLTLMVEGMWCPACAWLIEEVLRRTPGVAAVRAFFLSDTVRVTYLPHIVSPAEIMAGITRVGYRASLFGTERKGSVTRDLLVRFGISAILSANIMMLSFALYFGFFQDLSRAVIGYFSYPLALMATAVVFYGGFPMLRRAARGLRYGITSMDTLIAVGVLAAYAYSVGRMAGGSIHLYFDTASMLVTIVLLGKYIEAHAREKVSAGITELYELSRQKVRLLGRGRERWVAPEAVGAGDRFRVLSGERTSVEGRIVSGRGFFDQSVLTGESRPVKRGPQDDVMAGSLLREGEAVLEATRPGSESSLRQMISLVEEALEKKEPGELFADRATRLFVPAILTIAAVSALLLLARGTAVQEVLLRSLTVLVIACPCALGIAAPLAKVVMVGAGRSRGILVRDPKALEHLRSLDVLVFDKTGTLTEGQFVLQEVITDNVGEEEALCLLASLEAHSPHFLAREIVRRAEAAGLHIQEARDIEVFEGLGVRGNVGERGICAGNRRFMLERGVYLRPGLDDEARSREQQGETVVFFAIDGDAQGLLDFGDPLRPEAQKVIEELRARGIDLWLVSGDASETTASIARSLGINRFRGGVLPSEKAQLVASLKKEGHRVGVVGDGLNDAAALAGADVGIAIGAGASMIQEASDLTILTPDLNRLLEAYELSTVAVRTARQNLAFAFAYNAAAIPLAVSGLLNPLVAVAAMFMSSLTVIGNTLRVAGKARREAA